MTSLDVLVSVLGLVAVLGGAAVWAQIAGLRSAIARIEGRLENLPAAVDKLEEDLQGFRAEVHAAALSAATRHGEDGERWTRVRKDLDNLWEHLREGGARRHPTEDLPAAR